MSAPERVAGQAFSGIDGLVSNIPKGTAHTDAVIIPEITADFPHDHWNSISGKFDIQCAVKIVDGLHKADTADLEQVIGIFTAGRETLDDA